MSESFSPEPAPRLRSPESVERVREYFDLQLLFAEAVAEKTAEPIEQAVLKYKNFHRRFGFGRRSILHARWAEYAELLRKANSHDQRLQKTLEFFATTKPWEGPQYEGAPEFGCFTYERDKEDPRYIHIHFSNDDPLGPLSEERMAERLKELKNMFSHIKQNIPDPNNELIIEGGSWLYNRHEYRRLFPDFYTNRAINPKALEEVKEPSLNGTARWGQFLNSDGSIKQDLKKQFIEDFKNIDPDHLGKTFPLPTFRTEAPIQYFYDKYEIPNDE
jgi:hypothetical protein